MEEYKSLAVQLMGDLVAFDTSNKPGNEQPLAEYIADVLKREGFETELQIVGENRANVVASYGKSEKNLILTGHLDVVPPGDGWQTDPFKAEKKENRFYGRGTCDMKGGIAAMMAAAIQLKREKALQDTKLLLVFVADEEIDGAGTKYFVKHFCKGTQNIVVIGEPTENEIFVAHRGVSRFRVELHGKQCHSGRPQEGINALTMLGKFLVEIDRLNKEKSKIKQAILPPPTVAATVASGGVKDNVIPGLAEVVLDFRTVPGDTASKLGKEVECILEQLFGKENDSWSVDNFIDVAPGMTESDSASVKIAKEAYQMTNEREAKLGYFSACCDMSCFLAAGFDTIICGPGSIAQAHTVDEYIEIDQLKKAVELYKNLYFAMEREERA